MNDFYLSELYIYPIKSLGGISLQQSEITETGLQYDRKWMLIEKAHLLPKENTLNWLCSR
jgi:uncharacterized protein YcbX